MRPRTWFVISVNDTPVREPITSLTIWALYTQMPNMIILVLDNVLSGDERIQTTYEVQIKPTNKKHSTL